MQIRQGLFAANALEGKAEACAVRRFPLNPQGGPNMSKPQRRKAAITPKYLLDRLDFQLYTAAAGVRRLKTSLDASRQDFGTDRVLELRELNRRVLVIRRRLRALCALPQTAWRAERHNS